MGNLLSFPRNVAWQYGRSYDDDDVKIFGVLFDWFPGLREHMQANGFLDSFANNLSVDESALDGVIYDQMKQTGSKDNKTTLDNILRFATGSRRCTPEVSKNLEKIVLTMLEFNEYLQLDKQILIDPIPVAIPLNQGNKNQDPKLDKQVLIDLIVVAVHNGWNDVHQFLVKHFFKGYEVEYLETPQASNSNNQNRSTATRSKVSYLREAMSELYQKMKKGDETAVNAHPADEFEQHVDDDEDKDSSVDMEQYNQRGGVKNFFRRKFS